MGGWDRFISIKGEKSFHIGNICGTCSFFFTKKNESSKLEFEEQLLIHKMNNGVGDISEEDIKKLSDIVPNGEYSVLISEVTPKSVIPKFENDYFSNELLKSWDYGNEESEEEVKGDTIKRTEYYRGDTFGFEEKDKYFEFIIPLYNSEKLNEERVNHYKEELKKGKTPTILSFGVLDVKTSMHSIEINGEYVNPEFPTHWCLANYLLDGHHKLKAGAEMNKPIRMITFLSKTYSWQLTDKMIAYLNIIKD